MIGTSLRNKLEVHLVKGESKGDGASVDKVGKLFNSKDINEHLNDNILL